jgi:hypothetical protein
MISTTRRHATGSAGWDSAGKLELWRHIVAAEGINGIAYHAGNEVLEEGLEGMV